MNSPLVFESTSESNDQQVAKLLVVAKGYIGLCKILGQPYIAVQKLVSEIEKNMKGATNANRADA